MHALIIDDDAVVQMLASKMLESKGFVVTGFKSEEEVISFLSEKESYPPIDVILLDLQIGSVSGKEMYQRLNAVYRPLPPVIFISSHSEEEARELDLVDDRGSAYLQKPFKSSVLFGLLEKFGINA